MSNLKSQPLRTLCGVCSDGDATKFEMMPILRTRCARLYAASFGVINSGMYCIEGNVCERHRSLHSSAMTHAPCVYTVQFLFKFNFVLPSLLQIPATTNIYSTQSSEKKI